MKNHIPKVQAQPQLQSYQINTDDATRVTCSCGCNSYLQANALYTVSPILSPTGKELNVTQPIFICAKCFLPPAQKS